MRPTPRAGLRLGGRYEIVGLLGRGSTSDVYLANDVETGRHVIIKRLRCEPAMDSRRRGRFLNEARAAMAIDHASVVRVLGIEEPEADRPFLVMEALVGEPLSLYLNRHGVLPQDLALVLARQAAAGLAAAHEQGVVHRDVKPGNLFLLGDTGAPYGLKVLDFGMAKLLDEASSSNLVLGTAQYMAPEQVLADPVDARTDVYALGVVLFRMVTGQLPFEVARGADLFSHQLYSPAPPPTWLNESIDPGTEAVILRAMRKHPENRYPSMRALMDDLDALVGLSPRRDRVVVGGPLVHDPDVYRPQNPKSRDVADILAVNFGFDPPPRPGRKTLPS